MQKQTLALFLGATIFLIAGGILVPQMLADGEPAPLRWSERDEVDLPQEGEAWAESLGGSPLDRTLAGPEDTAQPVRDEARIDVVLRGRVIDKFQQPVADASVWLDFGRGGARGGQAGRQRRVPDPVSTDREGRFAFQGQTFRNLRVSLQILHSAHAPGLFEKDLGEVGSDVDLGDLVLAHGGEITGRVTDLDGNGVAAAVLQLQPENGNRMRFVRDRSKLLADSTTDSNGYFRRAAVVAGDWSLSVTAKGHTEGRSPVFAVEDEQAVELEDIRLGPGYEVTGIVRSAQGQPIGKAEVTLRSDGRGRPQRGEGAQSSGGREHRTSTDEQGQFFLEHLPAGPLRLDASADGFLDAQQEGVDPTLGQPLYVTMQDGLKITGAAKDAGGTPVSLFAIRSVRLRRLPQPGLPEINMNELAERMRSGNVDDTTREQIRAQMQSLRGAGGGEGRRGGRGENGGERDPGTPGSGQRPGAGGRDLGKPQPHPNGEFLLTGLQEGVYEVHIQSPEHAHFQSAEVELRSGTAPPHLLVTLDPGVYVAGLVTDETGAPIRGSRVTLRSSQTAPDGMRRRGAGAGQGNPPNLEAMGREFQRQAAGAVATLEATTDAEGEFVLKHAQRGSYRLQAEARGFANGSSDPFDLQADRSGFVLRLGKLGGLTGMVRGLVNSEFGEARVAALPLGTPGGGLGAMFGRGRNGNGGGSPWSSVAIDGSYHIDDLAPGGYVVRSWIGSPQDLMLELGPKLADGSLSPDVVVRAGEVAQLDLVVVRPQVGGVAGTVLHNGSPATGFQVELSRQEDGEPPADRGNQPRAGGPGGRGGMFGNMGRSFQGAVAASGRFQIEKVPAGAYRLRVQAGRRGGLLYEEVVQVIADSTLERSIVVQTQSLQGSVTRDDGGNPEELTGRISLLPGLTTLPTNLGAWQRENRSFDARVQNGKFRFDALKPGDYLLVLTIRGRERVSRPIVVDAGQAASIVVPAGKVAETPGAAAPATPRPSNGAVR